MQWIGTVAGGLALVGTLLTPFPDEGAAGVALTWLYRINRTATVAGLGLEKGSKIVQGTFTWEGDLVDLCFNVGGIGFERFGKKVFMGAIQTTNPKLSAKELSFIGTKIASPLFGTGGLLMSQGGFFYRAAVTNNSQQKGSLTQNNSD